MKALNSVRTHRRSAKRGQAGLTLVELMVALTLGLLVAAAAVAALIIARQGYTSVDGSTQLRENARFAFSQVERIAVQAGFENAAYGSFSGWKPPTAPIAPQFLDQGVRGFDNALVSAGTLPSAFAHGSRTSVNCGYSDTSCMNGSDILILRFWGSSRAGVADGSMINCAGVAEPEAATAVGPAYSVFHLVRSSSGEPTLACSFRDPTTLAWSTVPLVQGVEGFRVMYGTDGVTPNACAADTTTGADSVAERYLTAAQLDAAGAYCANNWARVRSLRIGLLVRSPVGTAVVSTAASWPVLSAPGAAYPFGAPLAVAADGRLRQQMVFTVHLRNAQ
jgi:type IV pilus assembly protein PilW